MKARAAAVLFEGGKPFEVVELNREQVNEGYQALRDAKNIRGVNTHAQ